jgi:hypothetical protein
MQIVVIISHILLSINLSFAQKLDENDLLNKEEKDATLRKRLEPRLSDKYYRGRYLIYDCEKRFFACVNLPSFYNCRELRQKEKDLKEVLLSCAPLKQFKSQKDCFDVNYSLIHRVTNKSFCINQAY